MKSILKCIYVILFLILIASSSALLILVASENMQNLHSNNEKAGKQLNEGENIVRENLWKSESVSCDKKDSKNINNFPLRKDEDFTKSNEDNIEEKLNYLEREDTMNSLEITERVKITEAAKQKQQKISEPYLSESNIISDSNVSFEITSKNNNIGNEILSSSSLDEKKISLPIVDEFIKDPAISQDIPPDKVEQRIIDSGGSTITSAILNDDQQLYSTESTIISDTKNSDNSLESNVTEEKPIPVFSEWAQKQMEEAEKKLEKNVVNISSMKKNITNGNKQIPNLLKLRVKNYASPDCGAKIITSNSEAQNTGALLTSSKDEYMLSPCTSRIWFVVELCEAIQAKQIDFANFELFSSSPKNFSVAVSNRFPTRDWSNVGRYIAEDTRNIQSFDLFPHLFGKYVRVDVHSHYNSEHFCPISLLRVYGTSEFEAFDSENRNPYEDIDDVDDEIVQPEPTKKEDNNLFKSASDAVMSIVKKAAQVLSKEKPSRIEFNESSNILCFTPIFDAFSCSNCSQITIDNVNYLLSCKYKKLIQLLGIKQILFHLIRSQVCFDRFNIDINHTKKMFYHNWSKNISTSPDLLTRDRYQFKHSGEYAENFDENEFFIDEKRSYYLSSINLDYLGAMCHILKYQNLIDSNLQDIFSKLEENSLNLTIEKMQMDGDSILNEKIIKELEIYSNTDRTNHMEKTQLHVIAETGADSSVENYSNDVTFSKEDIKENKLDLETTTSTEDKSSQNLDPIINEGINIFNIVDNGVTEEDNLESISEDSSKEKLIYSEQKNNDHSEEVIESSSTSIPPISLSKVKEDDSQWENDEKLFNEQLSSDMNLSGNQITGNNGVGTTQYKSSQHTESIFTRLSNRIKALERNMSLSGQYLEELSRRYKKQVEELQTSFSKTLTAIEDQNRRFTELELVLQKENAVLKSNLDELNVKLHFWMFILIIVTIIGLIYILTSFYSVTLIGRRQKSLYKKFEETSVRRKDHNEKFKRRKSADGVPKNINLNSTKKIRRPSEEAMKINGSYKDLMIDDTCNDDDSIDNLNSCEEYCGNNSESSDCNRKSNVRNRKLSICYSKENQPIIRNNPLLLNFNKEQNLKDVNKYTKNYLNSSHNSKEFNVFNNDDAESETIPEEIIVVDDESDQFVAGDSPYEYVTKESNSFKSSKNGSDKNKKNSKSAKLKKSESSSDKIRRLSSPSFLKSPFNKKTTTESTGWEWIRNGSNKNRQKSKVESIGSPNNKKYFKYVIHNSLDSDQNIFVERNPSPNSTVSEQIIFHNSINNSENDSFRTTNSESSSMQAGVEGISNNKLMEELGTNTATNNSNSNGISNDNDGKNKTKKQRSFKKIFKKVF